ncbi:MAG: ComEA family DNA-binding protein [Armatimonadota bacterium]|nr:ComEA family DNA-binding protein [Armatimonadota bacterium]MDR7532821.1 ComEA family DNA-binding protein [Armatimonadota bacterium]
MCASALLIGVASRSARAPAPVVITTPRAPMPVRVHVAGEVVWPGLYALSPGARVQDAIAAARGPTLLADLDQLNLAAVLRDGDRVLIPRRTPTPPSAAFPGGDASPRRRAPCGPPRPAGPAQRPRSPAGVPGRPVNVNTASADDLERLPGVGPVLARRIVHDRQTRGPFRRVEDLERVRGIGPGLVRRLRPLVRLD